MSSWNAKNTNWFYGRETINNYFRGVSFDSRWKSFLTSFASVLWTEVRYPRPLPENVTTTWLSYCLHQVGFFLVCTFSTFMEQYVHISCRWHPFMPSFFMYWYIYIYIYIYIYNAYKRLHVLVCTIAFILSFLLLCSMLVYYGYTNAIRPWLNIVRSIKPSKRCKTNYSAILIFTQT